MTWEWAIVLSVLMVCGTAIVLLKQPKQVDYAPKLKELWDALTELTQKINKAENVHGQVQKLADETQKMISNANILKGMRAQR